MKDRKGITLTSLVIVIIIMLILAGVGTYTGINTVRYVKRTQFNNELKIIHARVDEIVEKKLTPEELNEYGKAIEEQTDEIKQKIQTALEGTENTGFRYFEKQDLEEIGVDGIDRQVIINFSTREVVDINGIKLDGIYIYRMEKWNPVEYQNQNTEAPTFNLSKKVYGLNATIEVTDIEYKNGITKGSIRYGEVIDGEVTLWKTGSSSITIEKSGTYRVQVIDAAGNVAEKDVEVALANKPKLVDGMTPVVYDENIGKWKVVDEASGDWYDYASDTKKWANAMTQDGLQINSDGTIESFGSMWIWIPRYMYQIPAANYHTSTAGVINVKFLKGTTNIATDGTSVKISNASGGDNWNVHPAFCDGTSNGFANGEWDKELTGMWVAKFEAGYASGNNNAPVVESNVKYEQANVWGRYMEVSETATSDEWISARNWLDGIYGEADTKKISYPTFQPLTYSMNYISHSDAYELALDMTSSQNIYGFTSTTADTHLMKDSEWGMVAYFSQSQYGLNGTDIAVNNVNLNNGNSRKTKTEGNAYASVYAVTGVTRGSTTEGEYVAQNPEEFLNGASDNTASSTDGVYTWNQKEGQKASSSGNIYGIYDLSGGVSEKTAGYVANENDYLKYGTSLAWDGTNFITTSTKYAKAYACDTTADASGKSDIDAAGVANYEANKLVYGNAMYETSTAGKETTAWFEDLSSFPCLYQPFSYRGGVYYHGGVSGLFNFNGTLGHTFAYVGFRAVVVAL